ncbi:hypothetical protein CLV62_11092 [Dysgonomonas alginatilytica]|uniref:Uncharacterized protein n=2 Tax=Dysgonomonas alginatilytica TaxID=1605892 RepID=A0A2V3PRS0_9BACT|nr:hypothetical protein CLV62_11092 [Dysgonomonas alginatilytica]
MDIHQRYITSFVLLIISVSIQAQSLKSYIKDDMKKELLKQVKPKLSAPGSTMQKSPLDTKAEDADLLEYYQKYKAGSVLDVDIDKNYKINPNLTKYSGKDPINKLPDGYVVPVFNLGHWGFANPSNRVDGLVTPSGTDLSGGGRKRLSKKSRKILINVYKMTLDDDL